MNSKQSLEIEIDKKNLTFHYGTTIFHPQYSEKRYLNDIRMSLKNEDAIGPDLLYNIAMDVGKKKHYKDLIKRNLLYGIVIFNSGKIGNELIRSQGHIHDISKSCHSSTAEIYEIWEGRAYIYMQEMVDSYPGKCFAIQAKPGDIVLVPPGWAHYTVNADTEKKMVFGAWCIRDFGFIYKPIKEMHGLAYYPVKNTEKINWLENSNYKDMQIEIKTPRIYSDFGITSEPLYEQYEKNNNVFDFITQPEKYDNLWPNFIP